MNGYNQAITRALDQETAKGFAKVGNRKILISQLPRQKQNKYGVAPIADRTYKNIPFDSKKEMNRYIDLERMQMAGVIVALQYQVKFQIFSTNAKWNGKPLQPIHYIADFCYRIPTTNRVIVEDVKGKRTAVYEIKKKLFIDRYPLIEFREV